MTGIKLIPSAQISIRVLDPNGNLVESGILFNALKSSFIEDFGLGEFSNRFTVRLGHSNLIGNFFDSYMVEPIVLAQNADWPLATGDSVWPMASLVGEFIEWETTQKFNIPAGTFVGQLGELGFNFAGDQSDKIHARAVFNNKLTIDSGNAIELDYKLVFKASFSETQYQVSSVTNGTPTTHDVIQRWARLGTLYDILGNVPQDNDCRAFSGELNTLNVEPAGFIGASEKVIPTNPSTSSIGLEAVFSSDSANALNGIRSIEWTTIPIKVQFTPPLQKTSEHELKLNIAWELSL